MALFLFSSSHEDRQSALRQQTPMFRIKSKLLVLGAVNTTINDKGCHHVTGRFESTRMLLSKQTGWLTFVQSHPSVE